MSRRRPRKKKKRGKAGLGAVVEPGVGALYVRGAWMKKLAELGKGKQKPILKRIKKKQRK